MQKVSLPTSKGVGFSRCFIFSCRCITAQRSQPHIWLFATAGQELQLLLILLLQGFSFSGFPQSCFCFSKGFVTQVLWFLAMHHSSAIFTTRPFDFCPWPNLAISCNFCSSSSSFSRSQPSSPLSSSPPPPSTCSYCGFYFLITTISTLTMNHHQQDGETDTNPSGLFATSSKPVSKCKSAPLLDLSSTIWVDSMLIKINSLLYKMRSNFTPFDIWPHTATCKG